MCLLNLSDTFDGATSRFDGDKLTVPSHENGRAEVAYDPGKVTTEQIVEAIEKLGYQARLRRRG